MKLKTALAIGLVSAIFIYISIIFFGAVDDASFRLVFPLFISMLGLTILIMNRHMFKTSDFIFLMVVFLIFSISLGLYASHLKEYATIVQQVQAQNMANEINALSATNNYYASYVNYLQTQIQQYAQLNTTAQPPVQNPVIVVQPD